MTSFFVTYTGDASTSLDRDYYVRHHVPLVRRAWERHGLTAGSAFFPAGQEPGVVTLYIGESTGEDALRAALDLAAAKAVIDDVARFTDAEVRRQLAVPLDGN